MLTVTVAGPTLELPVATDHVVLVQVDLLLEVCTLGLHPSRKHRAELDEG